MAHNLLADAYLQRHEFEKSREHAASRDRKSERRAKATLLLLGYALANLGRDEEAIQALNDYAGLRPNSPVTPEVMALVGQLKRHASDPSHTPLSLLLPTATQYQTSRADTDELLPMKSWEPPSVDDAIPTVASGVTCPSGLVIEKAGERVTEFVNAVSRFAAVEKLKHETVDELGRSLTRETRQYNYLVDISEVLPGVFSVNELRSIQSRLADFPDNVATLGLPALVLVFSS